MGFIRWCLILICKYLTIYALNSLKLGILILILSFSISLIIRFSFTSWLSLIFFIIYIGGLLVLFFYLSSLNYKPLFSNIKKKKWLKSFLLKVNILIIFLLSIFYYKYKNKVFRFTSKKNNNYRYNLFNKKEQRFIILIGIVLLLVLWLVTKLTCKTRGALRPTFNNNEDLSDRFRSILKIDFRSILTKDLVNFSKIC